MATERKKTQKSSLQAKVVQIRVQDGSQVGPKLEEELNAFLQEVPNATIHTTQMHMLDIGGPSQADIVVIYTIVYSL